MTNYWIFKVTTEVGGLFSRTGYELFEHRIKEGFWPIIELSEDGKRETKVHQLEEGDQVLFFLVSKSGGSFLGTCTLASNYTRLTEEQAKQIIHREFIDSDQGFFIEKFEKWAKPLSTTYLRRKESLDQKGKITASHFKGYIKKLNKHEYDKLVEEHQQYF